MAKDYDWTKANWWDYPEDDDVEVKEIEVDVSDLMLPKEYAYGGGVGTLFEPTPTYHQYHDMTAPLTYGTLMDQRRGFKLGGGPIEEEEIFGLQNIIGADLTPYNQYAKKSLDKAPWNQDNPTMTSGVVEGITNSDMILPQRKPRGSIYNDAAVFEDLVSGSDIPQDMYSQSQVNEFRDPLRDMEAGITWTEEDKGAYPQLYADFLSGYTTGEDKIPGMGTKAIDFKDAPVDFRMRANNPMKGPIDAWRYKALRAGDPVATARWMEQQGMELPPNLQGIDTRNFLEKTGDKLGDVFTGAKEGIPSLAGKIKKGGEMLFGPLSMIASMRNPLNPESSNYNPELQSQVNFLKEQGGFGVMDQSGLRKITGGRLQGKNLVSGFGTNDIFGMYEKDLEKLEKTLGKLPKQWSTLKKSNPARYKQKYDSLVAKINQNKAEQKWLKDNDLKKGNFPNKKIKPTDKDDGAPYQKGSWGGHGSVEAYDKSQQATYDRIKEMHGGGSKSSKSSKSSSSSSGGWGPWAKDGGIINIIR